MKLGNFFSSAPAARAVNPKPITFTAICKDKTVLPGGAINNTKKQVAAKIDACFEFIGVGIAEARRAAREHVGLAGQDDFDIELQYQMLWRAIREYDPQSKLAGEPLFATVQLLRELVELKECNRLQTAYTAYVNEEHPEVVDTATFRGAAQSST